MSEEIRDCVFMVSRNLRAEEGHDLAYLYDLPAKYREETCRPMVQMEAQQIIKNPATLAQAMERISRKDLASEVRKFKKRKKSMRISHGKIKQEELEDFASAHIDVARRQIEIAMESIRLIPKSVWNNCSQYTDHIIKAATDHCTEALNEISGLSGSLSQVTSDEDNSPLSSITSSSEIPVTMLPEKQKPQPLPKPKRKCIHQAWNASGIHSILNLIIIGAEKQSPPPPSISTSACQQEGHPTQPAQICHTWVATPLALVLIANKDHGISEDTVSDEDDVTSSCTGTTGDSGFCNASEFLRTTPAPPNELVNRPPLPFPKPDSTRKYMSLVHTPCTATNEYTSTQRSNHNQGASLPNRSRTVLRTNHTVHVMNSPKEGQDDDDHYDELQY